MISFKGVTKKYHPNVFAVQNVDLEIQPGEFVFLVGQSGAGKSTLVRLLTAEEKPTEGKVYVEGKDITRLRSWHIPVLRRQIGVVYQDFKLLEKKTAGENVAFALEVCGEPGRQIREIVPQVLSIVGLDDKADRYPRQLSGGEQQRVAIARALAHHPKILVADEPTGDLDSITTRGIVDLLAKINELGTTILFVTHNRDVVNTQKKRVVTMSQGVITSDRLGGKYFI